MPPALALWLVGLGIELHWNPPRQPWKNGVVEHAQDTGQRWAEPERCDDAPQLQRAVDEADRLQRELYPFVGPRSRWEVYPGLRHSGRPYTAAQEEQQWQLEPVLQHLASYAVPRRVDSTGQVSLYDRNYYVGALHRGQEVYVQFDPQRREWLFNTRQGLFLRSQPAVGIEAASIRALQIAGTKHKRSGR